MNKNIDKKVLLGAVSGFSVASVITFAQALNRRRERQKEVKEMANEIKNRAFPDISDILGKELDDELQFGTKGNEELDYIPKDELMEVFYYLIRLNSDLASDIRDNREEITALYSHLEELARANESEE